MITGRTSFLLYSTLFILFLTLEFLLVKFFRWQFKEQACYFIFQGRLHFNTTSFERDTDRQTCLYSMITTKQQKMNDFDSLLQHRSSTYQCDTIKIDFFVMVKNLPLVCFHYLLLLKTLISSAPKFLIFHSFGDLFVIESLLELSTFYLHQKFHLERIFSKS